MNLLFCHRTKRGAWVRAHVVQADFLDASREPLEYDGGLCLLRRLQRWNEGFKAACAFLPGRAEREGDRGTDSNGEFAEAGEAAALALHLPDAVEAHGNDGDAKVFGQQANTTLKWGHFRVVLACWPKTLASPSFPCASTASGR